MSEAELLDALSHALSLEWLTEQVPASGASAPPVRPRPGLPLPRLPDGSTLAVAGSGTYSVASRATRPDGTLVEVHATLRIGAGSGFGQLYAPLAWRTGEPY